MDVLEEYARVAPAGAPLNVQIFKEMEDLLNGLAFQGTSRRLSS